MVAFGSDSFARLSQEVIGDDAWLNVGVPKSANKQAPAKYFHGCRDNRRNVAPFFAKEFKSIFSLLVWASDRRKPRLRCCSFLLLFRQP
jgi:hypothetical protein